LLRHGETVGGNRFRGHRDDPLTDAGLAQMWQSVADGPQWDHIVTSPLRRCAQFAHALATTLQLPLTRDARFKEMHFGQWEGRSAAEITTEDPQALARFWRDPDNHPPPGGETLRQFQQRVLAGWQALQETLPGCNVLLVTHGGVIRLLWCHHHQRPLRELLSIEVAHASLHYLPAGPVDKPDVLQQNSG